MKKLCIILVTILVLIPVQGVAKTEYNHFDEYDFVIYKIPGSGTYDLSECEILSMGNLDINRPLTAEECLYLANWTQEPGSLSEGENAMSSYTPCGPNGGMHNEVKVQSLLQHVVYIWCSVYEHIVYQCPNCKQGRVESNYLYDHAAH